MCFFPGYCIIPIQILLISACRYSWIYKEKTMKKFTRKYKYISQPGTVSSRWFGDLTPCVYDIETTGLSKETNKIILTAMLIPSDDGVEITQFLAEDPFEESRVLEATIQHLMSMDVDYLITYNGASFDIPFTQTRLDRTRLPWSISYYDLDLYRFLRNYSVLPSEVDSLSQKSVESFFGIGGDRKDVITGRESVRLYQDYTRDGSPIKEKIILTHNREDVLQLYRLTEIMMAEDFYSVLRDPLDFEKALGEFGLPAASGLLSVKPQPKKNVLRIVGRQHGGRLINNDEEGLFSGVRFPVNTQDIKGEFRKKTADFTAEIPLMSKGSSSFVDLSLLQASDEDMERFSGLSGYVNGYLLLTENGTEKNREINSLSVWASEKLRRDLFTVQDKQELR